MERKENFINDLEKEVKECISDYINSTYEYYKDTYTKISNLNDYSLNEINKTFDTINNKKFTCVYFIRNKYTNYVKIGSSERLFHRIEELNSIFKCHFGIKNCLSIEAILYIPSGKHKLYESMLHKEYKVYNVFGEWFDITSAQVKENLPEGFYYNNILVDYITNDIPNDGFKEIKLDYRKDMDAIKQYIYDDILKKSNVSEMFDENCEYVQMVKDVIYENLGFKVLDRNNLKFVLLHSPELPKIIEEVNWAVKNGKKFRVDDYTFDIETEKGQIKTVEIGNLLGEEVCYINVIENKITSFLSSLNGINPNAE